MDLSQSLQIVAAILVLLAFVCWFFSARTWRWHTLAMVILNFIAGAAFLYMSLRTLATRRYWHDELRNKYEIPLASVEQKNAILLKGKVEQNKVLELGIKQLNSEIERITIDRGRVWRSLAVSGQADDSFSVAWKEKEGEREIGPHGLVDKSIVCVFGEAAFENGGEYLGEFTVVKAAPEKIELKLTYPPTLKDGNRIRNVTKVDVYESMPVDDRSVLGEGLADPNARSKLLGKLPDELQEELKKDGQPADPNDPPDRVFVEVKFLKDYTPARGPSEPPYAKRVKTNINADNEKPADEKPAEKPTENADEKSADEKPAEKPKDKTPEVELKFAAGQVTWLPKIGFNKIPGADQLIADRIAEAVPNSKPIYRRPMREFIPLFEELRLQFTLAQSDSTQLMHEIASVQQSIKETQAALERDKTQIEKLANDLPQFKKDRDALNTLLDQLQTQYDERLAKLRTIFKSNRQLADQITALHFEALEAANRSATQGESNSSTPDGSKPLPPTTGGDRPPGNDAVTQAK